MYKGKPTHVEEKSERIALLLCSRCRSDHQLRVLRVYRQADQQTKRGALERAWIVYEMAREERRNHYI